MPLVLLSLVGRGTSSKRARTQGCQLSERKSPSARTQKEQIAVPFCLSHFSKFFVDDAGDKVVNQDM